MSHEKLFGSIGIGLLFILAVGTTLIMKDLEKEPDQNITIVFQFTCFTAKGEVWLDRQVIHAGEYVFQDERGVRFSLMNATCMLKELGVMTEDSE